MTESVLVEKVPGESVVMKAVLKASISPSVTQITVSLYDPLWRQRQTASTPSHFFIVQASPDAHVCQLVEKQVCINP